MTNKEIRDSGAQEEDDLRNYFLFEPKDIYTEDDEHYEDVKKVFQDNPLISEEIVEINDDDDDDDDDDDIEDDIAKESNEINDGDNDDIELISLIHDCNELTNLNTKQKRKIDIDDDNKDYIKKPKLADDNSDEIQKELKSRIRIIGKVPSHPGQTARKIKKRNRKNTSDNSIEINSNFPGLAQIAYQGQIHSTETKN